MKAGHTVTGVHLRSVGSEKGPQYVEVLVEVAGMWVPIIKEQVADVGGTISHIVEPLGIERAIERQAKIGPR